MAQACYVLFGTNTDALALFEACGRRQVRARISPTPRQARATCGTSLLVACEDLERVQGIAREEGIAVESTARLSGQMDPTRDRFC